MLNYNDQEIAMTLLDIGNGKDKKKKTDNLET